MIFIVDLLEWDFRFYWQLLLEINLIHRLVHYLRRESARTNAHQILVNQMRRFEADLFWCYMIHSPWLNERSIFYKVSSHFTNITREWYFQSSYSVSHRYVRKVEFVKDFVCQEGFVIALHKLEQVYLDLVLPIEVLVLHFDYLIESWLSYSLSLMKFLFLRSSMVETTYFWRLVDFLGDYNHLISMVILSLLLEYISILECSDSI